MQFLSSIPWFLEVAVVFLVMMTVLVAAHEYGHYLFARMFGMGVEEFAVGMGKRVTVWRRKTYETEHGPEVTEFTVRALPVGGFVRIKGMAPEEDGSEVGIPGGFYSKSPWKRFLVLLAGPTFSILAGLALLIPIYAIFGIEKPNLKPVIGQVNASGAAGSAGLKPGDLVLSIDGQPINSFYQMVQKVSDSPNRRLSFEVDRNGRRRILQITPVLLKNAPTLDSNLDPSADRRDAGRIGVAPDVVRNHPGFVEALGEACMLPVKAVSGLVGLFAKPSNFENSVGGPATMVDVVAHSTEKGIDSILIVAALLSISVGIMNLLPFVPLDGGQMVVAVAEMLRGGRRLSMRVQETLQNIGATLVLVLIVAVVFVDVKRFVFPEKPPVLTPSPAPSASPAQGK